jgi:hypothetical protein
MKIRLKGNVFGAWTGKRGDEVDRPDAEAAQLIAGGVAEPAKPKAPPKPTAKEQK